MIARRAVAHVLLFPLVACGGTADEDVTELDEPETLLQREIVGRALEPRAFADLSLGAKIVGPQGPEVKSAMANAQGNFADLRSYVACPEGIDPCDPATAGTSRVYTYVHVVYPGEDDDPATGGGAGADSSDVERVTQFRMVRPAHGFTGNAGYSHSEALAAIGEKAEVSITCDEGGIVWAVSAGGGGDQWEQGEPLTFYWQSTVAPAGPADAYEIEVDGTRAIGTGPYPAEREDAANACLAERVDGD